MVRTIWALACALTFTGVAFATNPGPGIQSTTDPPQAVTHLIIDESAGAKTSVKAASSTIVCAGCLIAHGQTPTKGLTVAIPQYNDNYALALGGAVHNLA